MKTKIIALMALALTLNANAQNETTTTTTASKNKKFSLTTDSLYLDKSKSVSFGGSSLAVAWNIGLNMPENMDKSNGHSVSVAWDLFNVGFKLGNDHNRLSVGFGMIWNKYSSSNKSYFYIDANNNVAVSPNGDNAQYSRYLTYALTIPVMYTYKASNGIFVSAGPVVNFNLHSSIYNTTLQGDKQTWKSVNHTPVTLDLRLMAGYKHLGLMFKYSPINVIQKDKGPDFQSFAVGFVLK